MAIARSRQSLHIDDVVASQPEIGPTPPDGGYGWLILASAMIYNITIPTLVSVYGIILVKSLKEDDNFETEVFRIWDVDLTLVPILMVVLKLLLESWCKVVVKLFSMPRFMALAGLCTTIAGVLLSSFSTNAEDNDHIISIFAGIFAGMGCALTGAQTEVIISQYFRNKLTIVQRLVHVAPSIGNCIIPLIIGFLSTKYTGDVVITIYGAILMQNCFFLAAFTRPVYLEKVIRSTYNKIKDTNEDDDEIVFSSQNQPNSSYNTNQNHGDSSGQTNPQVDSIAEENDSIVVFKSNQTGKEIIDPAIERRFSSDFDTMPYENRFSSDFSSFDVQRVTGYQELENIDSSAPNPQPLYRETTIESPDDNDLVFAVNPDLTPGPARRTASLRKNLITLSNMLRDYNFYLHVLLHLCTTVSVTILGVIFPPLIWERNQSLNIWGVSTMVVLVHGLALCFVFVCLFLPNTLHEKARVTAAFCLIGSFGFYGISVTSSKSFLVIWGILSSLSSSATSILHRPLQSNFLNEFDTTATTALANSFVASFLMIWSVVYNYSYKACFFTASVLQLVTGCVFIVASFLPRR